MGEPPIDVAVARRRPFPVGNNVSLDRWAFHLIAPERPMQMLICIQA